MSTLSESKLKKKMLEKKKHKSLFTLFGELKEELKKVSWTTKPELIAATKTVVIATFCFGIGIYGVDFVVKGVLELFKRLIYTVFS